MGKAISLHVGVGSPGGLCGGDPLKGADGDARVMREIARHAGFASTLLIGSEATLDNVTQALDQAVDVLEAGDIMLITYSGHGNRIRDVGDGSISPESDGLFETWCLADAQLSDVKAYMQLTQFREDVRIVVVADCCYSGGFVALNMNAEFAAAREKLGTEEQPALVPILATRMARGVVDRALLASAPPLSVDEQMFADVLNLPRRSVFNTLMPAKVGKDIVASVLVLASTLDNEPSPTSELGGFFTTALAEVWDGGRFAGSYLHMISEVSKRLLLQTPNFFPFGKPCAGFPNERPFSITTLPCMAPSLAGPSRGPSAVVLANTASEFR